jgi:hypothetical protein
VGHSVLLVFGAPCQLRSLTGQEHGRTIPLPEVTPNGHQTPRAAVRWRVDAEGKVALRRQFIRQQTSVVNAIRAHHAEFGIVAPVGRHGVEQLLGVVADAGDTRLPKGARACVCRSWGATADAESSAIWVTPLCGHSK